jgi:hypothetical protein
MLARPRNHIEQLKQLFVVGPRLTRTFEVTARIVRLEEYNYFSGSTLYRAATVYIINNIDISAFPFSRGQTVHVTVKGKRSRTYILRLLRRRAVEGAVKRIDDNWSKNSARRFGLNFSIAAIYILAIRR